MVVEKIFIFEALRFAYVVYIYFEVVEIICFHPRRVPGTFSLEFRLFYIKAPVRRDRWEKMALE